MTDHSNRRFLGIGELGRRIIAAFVVVALAAIVADLAITSATASPALRNLVREQELSLTRAAATGAGIAYAGHGGWQTGSLMPVLDLVNGVDAAIEIKGTAGHIVAASPDFARFPAGPGSSVPVVANGHRVGSVTVRFGQRGLVAEANRTAAERWRVRLYAAAISGLLALIVSVLVARRITSPLERLLAAMRARGAGDRGYRIEDVRAVGVLGELLEGFNWATDSFDHQEKARRNLVANVAHELRTPVAVLQAGHEAMLDGVTEPTAENLASLRDEVLRLSRVLEDLRALAAAEAAALQLKLVPHDLADAANFAVAELRGAFEMAGLVLICDVSSAEVLFDDRRMREVITNLLTNAMKYTEPGGSVTVDGGPCPDGRARLRISDTGIGIAPDELPQVTERFFRGRRSPSMAAGSGLGLTIVAELVRAHRGDLDIKSVPGIGTDVTLTLPQAASSANRHGSSQRLWLPMSRQHRSRPGG